MLFLLSLLSKLQNQKFRRYGGMLVFCTEMGMVLQSMHVLNKFQVDILISAL